MEPYRFAVIGAGWRAAFFLRIAAALPERFRLEGLVVRNAAKGQQVTGQWGYATYRTVQDLLAAVKPEFLVSSVSYGANYEVNRALVDIGLPVLAETPPGATLEQMLELWEAVTRAGARFQVAEQFTRQPHHADPARRREPHARPHERARHARLLAPHRADACRPGPRRH